MVLLWCLIILNNKNRETNDERNFIFINIDIPTFKAYI